MTIQPASSTRVPALQPPPARVGGVSATSGFAAFLLAPPTPTVARSDSAPVAVSLSRQAGIPPAGLLTGPDACDPATASSDALSRADAAQPDQPPSSGSAPHRAALRTKARAVPAVVPAVVPTGIPVLQSPTLAAANTSFAPSADRAGATPGSRPLTPVRSDRPGTSDPLADRASTGIANPPPLPPPSRVAAEVETAASFAPIDRPAISTTLDAPAPVIGQSGVPRRPLRDVTTNQPATDLRARLRPLALPSSKDTARGNASTAAESTAPASPRDPAILPLAPRLVRHAALQPAAARPPTSQPISTPPGASMAANASATPIAFAADLLSLAPAFPDRAPAVPDAAALPATIAPSSSTLESTAMLDGPTALWVPALSRDLAALADIAPRPARLRLRPATMGELDVALELRREHVHLTLTATTAQAHDALSNAADDLAHALDRAGLQLAGLEVALGQPGGDPRAQTQPHGSDASPDPAPAPTAGTTALNAAPPAPITAGHEGHVDVYA